MSGTSKDQQREWPYTLLQLDDAGGARLISRFQTLQACMDRAATLNRKYPAITYLACPDRVVGRTDGVDKR
jgi:hypothetical protein